MPYDPRLTPIKKDLAARYLEGELEAPSYAEGQLFTCIHSYADLKKEPFFSSGLETQMLYGEKIIVYDLQEGWAWGQCLRDGYVGWLAQKSLKAFTPSIAPTHYVHTLRTYLYDDKDIKKSNAHILCLNSFCAVEKDNLQGKGTSRPFAKLATGGYVLAHHLMPIAETPLETPLQDFVPHAERLIGTPYLWGGRTTIGLDCSALVQLSLQSCGMQAPRDSDLQEKELGQPLCLDAPLKRGDLIFWKGHVGIMHDSKKLLHANAYTMDVALEPLEAVKERLKHHDGHDISSIKRFIVP